MADPQNANPTILNAADLPTRRRRKPSSSSSTRPDAFAHGIFAFPSPSIDLSASSFLGTTTATAFSDANYSGYNSSSGGGGLSDTSDEDVYEPIDPQEIYDLISTISDPEHPLTLGSLAVVNLPDISIEPTLPRRPSSSLQTVTVQITPTITHCSLATVIGLGVRVRLEQSLPPRFRVDVKIKEGTHSTAEEVNKQLADKERVAAALENSTLMGVLKKMLETCV